jgi:signal transduction histidine kinase
MMGWSAAHGLRRCFIRMPDSKDANGPASGIPARSAPAGTRLRTHLVLLICIALVPMILFSAATMGALAVHEHETLQTSLRDKAAQLASGVDSELQRTIAKLEVMGQSAALIGEDLQEFDSMARRVVQSDPAWENLLLLDSSGEQLVNVRLPFGAPLPKLNRPDLPLSAVQSLKPVVSDMAQAVIAARPLTVVYVPVVRDGRARYVLGAAIEPPNWREALHSRLPSGMHALLLDARSTVVTMTSDNGDASSGNGNASSNNGAADALVMGAASRGAPSVQERVRSLLERDAYVAYQKSSFSGWTVATYVPADEFDSGVRRSAGILLGGFLVMLVFGVSAALLVGRRTAGSISDLVASVKAVAHGGEPLPVRGHVAEVNEAGQALTETAALLSARLRSEEAARAQVQAADRAKSAFLAVLGHELRNPLATIRNSVEIIRRTGPASEMSQRASAVLDRQSTHMARLVDDLLDLARIEQGKIELVREVVDLRELLKASMEDQRTVLEEAGLRLSLHLPTAAVWVLADRVRMAQVAGNLLHNAAKFTPSGGEIRVALGQQGNDAEIRVEDDGAGIEPEALERIFEPFMQADQEARRAAGGLGLGLALVRTIVELHGGTVRASSAGRGQGSRFTIRLPGANVAG